MSKDSYEYTRYLITFRHAPVNGSDESFIVITSDRDITMIDELAPVREGLVRQGYQNVTIMAFDRHTGAAS